MLLLRVAGLPIVQYHVCLQVTQQRPCCVLS